MNTPGLGLLPAARRSARRNSDCIGAGLSKKHVVRIGGVQSKEDDASGKLPTQCSAIQYRVGEQVHLQHPQDAVTENKAIKTVNNLHTFSGAHCSPVKQRT